MLRITTQDSPANGVTLRLEGRLTGSNVDELLRVCRSIDAGRALALDLIGVTWLDEAGAAVIRELIDRDVTVAHCKPFVWHLLRRTPS